MQILSLKWAVDGKPTIKDQDFCSGESFIIDAELENRDPATKKMLETDLNLANGIATLLVQRSRGDVGACTILFPRSGAVHVLLAKNEVNEEGDRLFCARLFGHFTGRLKTRYKTEQISCEKSFEFVWLHCREEILHRLQAVSRYDKELLALDEAIDTNDTIMKYGSFSTLSSPKGRQELENILLANKAEKQSNCGKYLDDCLFRNVLELKCDVSEGMKTTVKKVRERLSNMTALKHLSANSALHLIQRSTMIAHSPLFGLISQSPEMQHNLAKVSIYRETLFRLYLSLALPDAVKPFRLSYQLLEPPAPTQVSLYCRSWKTKPNKFAHSHAYLPGVDEGSLAAKWPDLELGTSTTAVYHAAIQICDALLKLGIS